MNSELEPLDEATAPVEPWALFRAWFQRALEWDPEHANAMTLATADGDGRPSARLVLLKGFDEDGFRFYTNRSSRKGREIAANPRAALVLWWPDLHRQVRIEGPVETTDDGDSDAYFETRPRGSQIGAAASPQSEILPDRATLERRVVELERQFEGTVIPRPALWGGYRLWPESIEFWQGRLDRLHDRLLYRRRADGWSRVRLAP